MEIRAFRSEDVGAMRAIWNEVVEAADAFPQTSPLGTDAEALAFFSKQTRSAVAVEAVADAEDGSASLPERICGLYILHPNNIGRCAHVANASYAVASAMRGRGIGHALVEDSLRQLAPLGFTGLQFNAVVASNKGAILLYEKLGFTRVGIIPQGFRNDQGTDEDILIFYHAALPFGATGAAASSAGAPSVTQQTSASAPTPIASASVSASASASSAASPAPTAAAPAPHELPVLRCDRLTKRYGGTTALADVTLSLAPGRIVGLLGPNGSGKTTLIKLAAGLLQPTSGTLAINGMAPGPRTKAIVSYLPERPYFAPSMKVHEAVSLFQDFYSDFDRPLAEAMLEDLGVPLGQTLASLSKGTKEKVQLVVVMARRAALYLLDEPIGGVDPAARDYILRTIIGSYRRDATLLISTHLVYDVESVLDDVVLLGSGHVHANAPVAQFREQMGMSLDEYFRRSFAC